MIKQMQELDAAIEAFQDKVLVRDAYAHDVVVKAKELLSILRRTTLQDRADQVSTILSQFNNEIAALRDRVLVLEDEVGVNK